MSVKIKDLLGAGFWNRFIVDAMNGGYYDKEYVKRCEERVSKDLSDKKTEKPEYFKRGSK